MIKKYKDFLLEDYGDYSYEDPTFKTRFEKFKAALLGKIIPTSSSSSAEATPEISANNLSGDPKKMVEAVVKALNKYGITNPLVQKAILSTIGKESGFKINRSETSYKNTAASRIRSIFGSRFIDMSDAEIDALKKDDNAFWEKVYGGEWGRKNLGNTEPGDGAKFIGRGFNGLTGRSNYQRYTDLMRSNGTNADLVANPNLLYDPEIAAEANALYFLQGLTNPLIIKKYGNKDPNDFKDFTTALKAAVNANAGAANDINSGFLKQSYDAAVAASNKYNFDTTSTTA
jgi:predicted chitinase